MNNCYIASRDSTYLDCKLARPKIYKKKAIALMPNTTAFFKKKHKHNRTGQAGNGTELLSIM